MRLPGVVGAATVLAISLVARTAPVASAAAAGPSTRRMNVVILMSDDQRWDMLTPRYTPHIYERLLYPTVIDERFPNALHVPFVNAFVPDPWCCPSRASTLTGNHAHTTGVWTNGGVYGGFPAFDDRSTIAVDFHTAGYRTGMIGKYLNGYQAGKNRYVAPGWDKWFAVNTAAYQRFAATNDGRLVRYEAEARDYITRVLDRQARRFVVRSVRAGAPFFLYYAFTAPHGAATPDPRDVGRFAGEDAGTPITLEGPLEAAYGVDRAVNRLLNVLPANTIVIYMSDNGYLWGESKGSWGSLEAKQWPYNESVRIPMSLTSLDGSYRPIVGSGDIVLNIDLRKTLTRAAGVTPLTRSEGVNWNGRRYTPRSVFPLEHHIGVKTVPTYCGARERDWMYVRFQMSDGTYLEELYHEPGSDLYHTTETDNLAEDPAHADDLDRLRSAARSLCDPAPPGYRW